MGIKTEPRRSLAEEDAANAAKMARAGDAIGAAIVDASDQQRWLRSQQAKIVKGAKHAVPYEGSGWATPAAKKLRLALKAANRDVSALTRQNRLLEKRLQNALANIIRLQHHAKMRRRAEATYPRFNRKKDVYAPIDGHAIRAARIQAGLTIEKTAMALKISKNCITFAEAGFATKRTATLLRHYFHCTT
jgi:ribosome-binding protein aMBF1 (putative translation factor)